MAGEGIPQPKPKQEQEKSLEELRAQLNKLRNFMTAVLKERFGSISEAREQSNVDIEQRVRYARPEEGAKVRNLQLAQLFLRNLDKLEQLQKDFLDKNITKREVGVSGLFENLSAELDGIEEYIKGRSGYFEIPAPYEPK